MISLYFLIPPLRRLRQEVMTLKISKKPGKKNDRVVIKSDDVIIDLNEIKKKHPAIMFHLAKDAPELAKNQEKAMIYTLMNSYLHTIKND